MTEEVQTQEAEAAPELKIGDLAYVVQIIDVCSKRGAFEGSEMEAVGGVRGRLAAFVKAHTPPPEEGEEAAEDAPAAEEANG